MTFLVCSTREVRKSKYVGLINSAQNLANFWSSFESASANHSMEHFLSLMEKICKRLAKYLLILSHTKAIPESLHWMRTTTRSGLAVISMAFLLPFS